MAPKTKFKKEQIVDAAFEIARTEGLEGITIRKVAERLGSSIAPIYVNFKDVDELIQAVIRKTFTISKQLRIVRRGINDHFIKDENFSDWPVRYGG